MTKAIELAAKAGLGERSGGCFGAVVVRDGEIIGEGYNQVLSLRDPTCHAEMQAIRSACKFLNTHKLDDCTMYTSSEPCPMCLCATYWARIPRVVYASTIDDAKQYGNFDDRDFFDFLVESRGSRDGSGRHQCIECDIHARKGMIELWKKYKDSEPSPY